MATSPALTKSNDINRQVIIEIPSSSEDNDSIGSKRGHNNKSDAGASKRTKYEVPTPNFHPARPIPKRKGAAKLAKVSTFSSILIDVH